MYPVIIARKLTELVDLYKAESSHAAKDENIELEIRFKEITHSMFVSLYTSAIKPPNNAAYKFVNPVLECSINIISKDVYEKGTTRSDNTQYIRQFIFVGGLKVSDKYLNKTPVTKSVPVSDYLNYSIGLSKESECSRKFPTKANAIVRFKARVSFDYIPADNITGGVGGTPVGSKPVGDKPAKWRLDLTAVKQGVFSEIEKMLLTIRNQLFTASLTAENFIRDLNFALIDSYEVEIEYIGKETPTLEDLAIAKLPLSMANPTYLEETAYQEEIHSMAKLMLSPSAASMYKQSTYRLRQLGNQVISLTKHKYYAEVYPPVGYYLTDKADGNRCFISINGNRVRFVLTDTLYEFISGGEFIPGTIIVADGEFGSKGIDSDIILDNGAAGLISIKIWEVIVWGGELVSGGFAERIAHRFSVVETVKLILADNKRSAGKTNIYAATYIQLEADLKTGFCKIWDSPQGSEVADGMILTEPSNSYQRTSNYKWKPYDHNTIDFLAIKCPQKLLGIKPYEVKKDYDLYLLFVGIEHDMRVKLGMGFIQQYSSMFPPHKGTYSAIQFSPSNNPLAYLYYHKKDLPQIDRCIVELARDKDNTKWIFYGTREDRRLEQNYFGNNFRVAELTYINYIDPFNFADLWKPSGSYFTKISDNTHFASNKFKRFVIGRLLKDNLSRSKWIIDECGGRGADIVRYQSIGVDNALFIDYDASAIAELITRKFTMSEAKKKYIKSWYGAADGPGADVEMQYDRIHDIEYEKLIIKDVKSLTVHTLVANMQLPPAELIASTLQFGLNPGMVDGIVCNFGLHYMCDTMEHLRGLLLFNARMLRVGGLFMFTVFDGSAIFDLLKSVAVGQSWSVKENDITKYELTRKFSGDKLAPVGQYISVLLSLASVPYDEPLCNISVVIAEAAKLGFGLELNASMSTYLDKFSEADRDLYDKLTPDDKHYIGLYRFITLRLLKTPR